MITCLVVLLLVLQNLELSALAAQTSKVDYQELPQTLMGAGELDALFAVMDAMAGGIDWRLLHPHPCGADLWPGLVCEQGDDGLLHVTRLDFGYKPNPVCSTNASIPMAITKLPSLRSLFIFECFTITNTTIPSALKLLAPSLQELSLRTNSALVGKIPPELATLSALRLLSFSQNSLEGEIPADLGKLNNLQHLDLSDNLLSGSIPAALGNLLNLVILDLSVNSFTGSIPSSLCGLRMLQKMDLSFNSIDGPLPSRIGSLQSLEFLAVNDNSITGPWPGSLSNLTNLQYLIMENNPMKAQLPNFLAVFTSLMALSLSNSGYYGAIPEEVGQLGNLTVLSLDRNQFTGFIPTGLGQLPHLYQLNLSKNSLSGPVPFSPEFVHKLGRNLDLSGNLALCSHWAYPGMNSTGAGMGLCTDPKYSAFISSGSRGSPLPSPYSRADLRSEMRAAMCLCLVSTLYLQVWAVDMM